MIKSIPYRIERIENVQFAMFPHDFQNGQEVNVQTNCGYNVRSDLRQIRNVISVKFVQGDKLLLIAELACYYNVAPKGAEIIKTDGKVSVEFLRYMGSISVGVIRGVIHAKTEGTVLNPIVLPPVNLEEAIKSDMDLPEVVE